MGSTSGGTVDGGASSPGSGPSQGGSDGGSGSSQTSASGSDGGDPDTSGDSTGGDELGCEALPTFERDIVPILQVSCGAGDVSCHERTQYAATFDRECRGWLSLENADLGSEIYGGPAKGTPTGCPDMPLYERLLELDAWQCETYDERARYLVPCDPESSYLYRKISGDVCNLDNPAKDQYNVPSLTMPTEPYELSPEAEEIIYGWIARGAPRDGEGCEALCGEDAGSSEGGVGAAPTAMITHPGDGETRVAGASFPLNGEATDAEDGPISGAGLSWSSSAEGALGTGESVNWTPTVLGEQVITLVAEDSEGNTTETSLTLTIVQG